MQLVPSSQVPPQQMCELPLHHAVVHWQTVRSPSRSWHRGTTPVQPPLIPGPHAQLAEHVRVTLRVPDEQSPHGSSETPVAPGVHSPWPVHSLASAQSPHVHEPLQVRRCILVPQSPHG
jgi:hypothetical protein